MSGREERICDNIGLVHACARRFMGRGIEYDDLFQSGCMGLVKAADGFDEERGLKLSLIHILRKHLRGPVQARYDFDGVRPGLLVDKKEGAEAQIVLYGMSAFKI